MKMEPEYEKKYIKIEKKHPWFVNRRKLVYILMKSINKTSRILDYGCGSGIFLELLQKKYFTNLTGFEPSKQMRQKQQNINILNNKKKILGKFDVILLLDVIEHIKDDKELILEISNLLNPKGKLIITVPALNILWSSHDILNKHYRRYTKKMLKKSIKGLGLSIQRMSYWNFFFFFPIALIKMVKQRKISASSDIEFMPWPLDRIYNKVLQLENCLIDWRINFPYGINLFAILEKKIKLK